jgi:hypothetical protein
VKYHLNVMSDHFPIVAEVVSRKPLKRTKKQWRTAPTAKTPFEQTLVSNRFCILVEDCCQHSPPQNLNGFNDMLATCCQNSAAFARSSPSPHSLALGAITEAKAELLKSRPGDLDALRVYARARKHIKQQRDTENFLRSALRAPREDKQSCKQQQGLLVNGTLSFSPDVWEQEFTKYYKELFVDPLSGTEAQSSRLAHLEGLARAESDIKIPLFLLREVLTSANRRAGKAAGRDGVCWGALARMPDSAIHLMRDLIESRVSLN